MSFRKVESSEQEQTCISRIVSIGRNSFCFDVNEPVKSIKCGMNFLLILMENGSVYGIGNNDYGQLSRNAAKNEVHKIEISEKICSIYAIVFTSFVIEEKQGI